ncbi:hypothetical protein Tco_0111128, partial [Tanacetum coccineum]
RKAAHMLKYPDAKVINLGLDDTIEPIPEVLNQDIRIECAYHNEQTTDPRGIKGMKLHEQTMASRGSIDDDYKKYFNQKRSSTHIRKEGGETVFLSEKGNIGIVPRWNKLYKCGKEAKVLNLLKKGLLVQVEAIEASKRRRSMLDYRIQQLSKVQDVSSDEENKVEENIVDAEVAEKQAGNKQPV